MAKKFSALIEKAYDYEEVLQRQNLKHEDVLALRETLKAFPTIPRLIFDKHLVLFTNLAAGDVDRASEFVQRFYHIKQSSPVLFHKRDPDSKSIRRQMAIQELASLPVTQDNNYVFIHRALDFDTKEFNFNVVYRMFMMMAEAQIYKEGPRDGAIFISDWSHVKFGHLFRPGIRSMKVMLDFLRNACPVPLKAIHVLNSSYIVHVLIAMVRPLMWSELFDIIHVHSSSMDYEEFFHKHLPRSHMPADYGGDLPTLKELHDKNCENLSSMREYFLLEEQHMMQKLDDDDEVEAF